MKTNINDIAGFQLVHTIKGRSTVTRFRKEEFPLFREWVEICVKNGYKIDVSLIREDGSIEPVH